jgi:hypothetical protein
MFFAMQFGAEVGSSSSAGRKKAANDWWYDVAGWVVLGGIIAGWVILARNAAPPQPPK